jgi:hypothetical protein
MTSDPKVAPTAWPIWIEQDALKTKVGRARIAEAQSRRWRAYRERRQGTVAIYWRLRCAVKQKAPLVRGAFRLRARL